MNDATSAPKRRRRATRRYGELVKVAARISGRSPKTIYAVLKRRIKSAQVSQAIAEAKRQIAAGDAARGEAA